MKHFRMITTTITAFIVAAMVINTMPPLPAFAKQAYSAGEKDDLKASSPKLIVKLRQANGDITAPLKDKKIAAKQTGKLWTGKSSAFTNPKMAALADKLFTVELDKSADVKRAARELSRDARVEYAEPNYIRKAFVMTNDPLLNEQWALNNTGNQGATDADIDAPEAWDITHDSTLTVGVIDTGIDYNHPDLYLNMWVNQAEIPPSRKANLTDINGDTLIDFKDLNDPVNQGSGKIIDINSDGRIDASDILAPMDRDGGGNDLGTGGWAFPGNTLDGDTEHPNNFVGWNFVTNTNDPFDDYGHGSHVAGSIGAMTDNGVGIAGVNWDVKLAGIKFLDAGGSGWTEDAVKAVLYTNAKGMKITSNSWGGGGYSQALYDVISAANDQGNLFIAAAGNWGQDTDASPMYPAAYDLPNIISVAATDAWDNLAYFSNYGVTSVDLGAPGVDILSTVPTGSCNLCDASGYMRLDGTSMATPHVSGAAALLWSEEPSLTNAQVKQRLMDRADIIDSLAGKTVSEGRLNLHNLFVTPESVPPTAVTDLSAEAEAYNAVTLHWSATGDDGMTGRAAAYDVRYALNPITELNFDAATKVSKAPRPSDPGTDEYFTVRSLDPLTTYYFAVKVKDDARNLSPLSNVASATTPNATTLYFDDMEKGQNGWSVNGITLSTDALWHLSARKAVSPTTAWYLGKESTGTYDTGGYNISSLTSPVIPLQYLQNAELVFSQYVDVDPSWDYLRVQVRPVGNQSWSTLSQITSVTNGSFQKAKVDLSGFDGQAIEVRFIAETYTWGGTTKEGWYIDDFVIRGNPPANTPPVANAGADQTVIFGQTVTLDGSLSYDNESPVTYLWNLGDSAKPKKTAIVTHRYKGHGTYTATLTVTDESGLTASDSVTINVIDKVTIAKAKYNAKLKTLTVVAKSSAKQGTELTLPGFAKVTRRWTGTAYEFTVTNLVTKPASVMVNSTLGGTATKTVN